MIEAINTHCIKCRRNDVTMKNGVCSKDIPLCDAVSMLTERLVAIEEAFAIMVRATKS